MVYLFDVANSYVNYYTKVKFWDSLDFGGTVKNENIFL